jgi:hypothetical protein
VIPAPTSFLLLIKSKKQKIDLCNTKMNNDFNASYHTQTMVFKLYSVARPEPDLQGDA